MKAQIVILLFASSFLFFQGCSILGLTIGSVVDKSNKRMDLKIQVEELKDLPEGTSVFLKMKDGKTFKGNLDACIPIYKDQEQGDFYVKLKNFDAIITANSIEVDYVVLPATRGIKNVGFIVGGIVDAAILFALWTDLG